MREAPVGWQCVRCVRQDSRQAPVTRWRPRTRGPLGASRITPGVLALIVVNVVIFLIEESHYDNIVRRFALLPSAVHQGQTYRLLTAAFLHANFTHILFNMIALAVIGPAVEVTLGEVRFGVLYLLAALGGSVASYLLSDANLYGVGASGAIMGLMGAYWVLARRNRWETATVTALIAVNVLIGFVAGGIDWRAHFGGLLIGGVVAFGFSYADTLGRELRLAVDVAVPLVVVGVLALLVQLPPGHVNL
jgi:membrane associated rhomboid family serine protease